MYRIRVHLLPPRSWLAIFIASCPIATAIEIRGYDANVNKWLKDIPGQFLYLHPPYVNPNFTLLPGAKLLGIGWPEDAEDWTRQIALISPRHAVYATHYTLDPSWLINYLGSDGLQHQYAIESQTPIFNNQGQKTDLMLVTFTTPITAPGVKPFRVLNLADEAAYKNKPLLVCGSFVDASTTKLDGFTTLTNDSGFDTTRFIYFDYDRNASAGNAHTCTITPGDSGGPLFVLENNEPAIVGTISSYDNLSSSKVRSYAASIPAYMPQVDALMEVKGYHITRVYPATTTVAQQITASGTLRQMKSGSITLQTSNTGAAQAHNLTLQITFSAAPTTVSGTGWVCEPITPTLWSCRRGGLANATTASLAATWNSLPNSANLQITSSKTYDGGAVESTSTTLPLLESYTSWIQGTIDTAQEADPDHDGISNLLEYAFGGSPAQPSFRALAGHPQLPQILHSGNRLLVKYPHRTDATSRGITQTVEFSTNLAAPSWQTTAPTGTTVQTAAYTPVSPGYEQITLSIPINESKRFVRLKVALDE